VESAHALLRQKADSIERHSSFCFVTAFALATIAGLVRTLDDSSACVCVCAIFDSSAAASAAEKAVSESNFH
jgi:hypothetical protein